MNITIEIPDDIIRDAIGSAQINYWARTLTWEPESNMLLEIEECDDGAIRSLTRSDWERGLQIMLAQYPGAFVRLITRKGDAYTGDLLIQCAAFGEEKYA